MNFCHFAGRLTHEVEGPTNVGEHRVIKFSVAVNGRKKKGGKDGDTLFLRCEAWNVTADNIAKFFTKGDAINVHGELFQENWEDKKDGSKRSAVKLRVNAFDFPIGGKKADGEAGEGEGRPAAGKSSKPKWTSEDDGLARATSLPAGDNEEDIPF